MDEQNEVAQEPTPASGGRFGRRHWMALGAAGVVLLLAVAAAAGSIWSQASAPPAGPDPELSVVAPKGPPPPVPSGALEDYEFVVGSERFPIVNGVARLPSGTEVKVEARPLRSYASDIVSFDYSPLLDIHTSTVNGSFEVVLLAPDGSRAKVYPLFERFSPDVVIGHLKFGLRASAGAPQPTEPVARRIGKKAYFGDAWVAGKQQLEYYIADVEGAHRVIASVYHPTGQRAHEEIDRALATIQTKMSSPSADFDVSIGSRVVSMFADDPHGLEIDGAEQVVSIARHELAQRQFAGMSFQCDSSLIVSETENPLMPSVKLAGTAYYVQLVTSATLSPSEIVDAVVTAVPGGVPRSVARDVAGKAIEGKKVNVPTTDGLVYQSEVYPLQVAGKNLAVVVEFTPMTESDAVETFRTLVETLQVDG
jgi:hypothetical protein